jgi:hypothetical protein
VRVPNYLSFAFCDEVRIFFIAAMSQVKKDVFRNWRYSISICSGSD